MSPALTNNSDYQIYYQQTIKGANNMAKLITAVLIAGILYAGMTIGKYGVTQQIEIMNNHSAQLEAIR